MRLNRRQFGWTIVALGLVVALGVVGAAPSAMAQAPFPTRPIQMVIPFAPGGATDLTTRAIAKAAEASLGQPVVIVNKPAGGGATAMQEVAKADPDGYTLINFTAIHAAIAPHMRTVPYDPVKDFTPLMLYGAFNTFVAVRADSPFRTVEDLLEFARKNPRVATLGVSVIGASSHLGMARLANDAKVQVTFVPFGGGAPAITALLGRHVTAAVTSGEVLPHVRSGAVRLLASLMGKRIAEFPNVPTVRDLGYGWEMNSWLGIAGPAHLPPAIAKRLQDAFVKAMDDEKFKRVMTDLAMVTARVEAEGARRLLEHDVAAFGELIKSLQIGKYGTN